jgi:hypothetical protein
MEVLNNVFESHIVSAAEAAYATLFCAFMPNQTPLWANSLAAIKLEPELWSLETAEVHVDTAAGLRLHGREVVLFQPHPPNQSQEILLSEYRDLEGTEILRGPQLVQYGFGIYTRLPALIATDVIKIQFSYRRLSCG